MINFTLQVACDEGEIPSEQDFIKWVDAVFDAYDIDAQIGVRIVNNEESAELNQRYRNKSGPTNVLSFNLSDEEDFMGDIVISAPVMVKEASEQNITQNAHYAHITVHACYHLLGFDHETESEANKMEQLEITTLAELGYANPYGDHTDA